MRAVAERDDELDAILRDGLIFPAYQPIIALADERPVGYEALARGPNGSQYVAPSALFAAATRAGRQVELGWLCVVTAFSQALAARVTGVAIFVNLDPELLGTTCPPHLLGDYETGLRDLEIVLEVTERVVRRNAAGALAAVTTARAASARIAMDDVGSDATSLAVMPIIRPDIIKIDREIIQGYSAAWPVTRVVHAIAHQAQHTGAQILAEGVETDEHLEVARSVGATLAQGWRFGPPGPLPQHVSPSRVGLVRLAAPTPSAPTPFAIFERMATPQQVTPRMLASLTTFVENLALENDDPAVLFVNVSRIEHLAEDGPSRYRQMVTKGVEIVVLARDIPTSWTDDVQYVGLTDGDPLADERTILMLGSHVAAGVFARRRAEAYVDCFDVFITYDRLRIIEAAHLMVQRMCD
jgi:EAL domain-containing protein (putative c-di-GMP-specific phosphodiesterase class I)